MTVFIFFFNKSHFFFSKPTKKKEEENGNKSLGRKKEMHRLFKLLYPFVTFISRILKIKDSECFVIPEYLSKYMKGIY